MSPTHTWSLLWLTVKENYGASKNVANPIMNALAHSMAVAHFSAFDVLSILGVLTTFRRAYDFSTCSRLLDVLTTSRRALDFLDVLRASNLPLLSDSSVGIASQYILCRIPRQGGKTTPPLFFRLGVGVEPTIKHASFNRSRQTIQNFQVFCRFYCSASRRETRENDENDEKI